MNLDNFTATGFTYDSATDSFWIGDHGTNSNDEIKLIQVSSDFSTVISSCQIGDYVNEESEKRLDRILFKKTMTLPPNPNNFIYLP